MRHHHFDGDHGVVDQQAEGDDERAQRNPLKVDAVKLHRHEHRGEHQRDRERDHGTRAQAQADQTDTEYDGDGFPERLHELVHGILDGDRLVGDEGGFDADRQVRRDLRHRCRDVVPERQDVAARAHRDGDSDPLFAVDPEHRLGGVGGPARDARDVAQPNCPAVLRDEVDGQDVLHGPERTGNPNKDLLVCRLHHAGRRDGVLRLQRGNQVGAVNTQTRQLFGGEFNVDAFVLRTEDIDFRNIRHLQELFADINDVIPQLPVGEAVRGEAVDDAIGVAELVIEANTSALRQRGLDVVHLLAHLVPDVRHLGLGCCVLQIYEDRGLARGRVALQIVQAGRFLQLALDAIGDLLERIADGGTRPCRLHHHGPDREVRIFIPSEPEI
jgi:hypothetical protein